LASRKPKLSRLNSGDPFAQYAPTFRKWIPPDSALFVNYV
jgi:hypothetical protein